MNINWFSDEKVKASNSRIGIKVKVMLEDGLLMYNNIALKPKDCSLNDSDQMS